MATYTELVCKTQEEEEAGYANCLHLLQFKASPHLCGAHPSKVFFVGMYGVFNLIDVHNDHLAVCPTLSTVCSHLWTRRDDRSNTRDAYVLVWPRWSHGSCTPGHHSSFSRASKYTDESIQLGTRLMSKNKKS